MEGYLRPTGPIAPDALLPGDPKRAMDLASRLLESPRMSNLSRGLWGYHGERRDGGGELTVQATGIGAPSAAIVIGELAEHGVRRAIRVGTAWGLGETSPGDRIVVAGALPGDGVSATLGGSGRVTPHPRLTASLERSCPQARLALVATTDVRRGDEARIPVWEREGAVAVDLTSAGLLRAGEAVGVELASTLVVVDAPNRALSHEEAEAECLELGALAAAALEPTLGPPS